MAKTTKAKGDARRFGKGEALHSDHHGHLVRFVRLEGGVAVVASLDGLAEMAERVQLDQLHRPSAMPSYTPRREGGVLKPEEIQQVEQLRTSRTTRTTPRPSNKSMVRARALKVAEATANLQLPPRPAITEQAEPTPKPPKPAKPQPKTPKPMRANDGRDRFGCRLGSRAAKINAVLSSTPKSASEIAAESGATSVANHLRWLLGKGYVVRTAEGYRLA